MVVVVSLAKAGECLRIMPDNHGLHTIGDGDLPRIVLSQSLVGATLVQRGAITLLPSYRLPSKCAKDLTHGSSIYCALQNFCIRDRRNPKVGTGIPGDPGMGWTAPVGGHLVEEVDDKRGVEQATLHLRSEIRSRSSPACRPAHESKSAPVTISSSRINFRTKVAFFIPARFERFARIPCSSLVKRTVRTAGIVSLLYVISWTCQPSLFVLN